MIITIDTSRDSKLDARAAIAALSLIYGEDTAPKASDVSYGRRSSDLPIIDPTKIHATEAAPISPENICQVFGVHPSNLTPPEHREGAPEPRGVLSFTPGNVAAVAPEVAAAAPSPTAPAVPPVGVPPPPNVSQAPALAPTAQPAPAAPTISAHGVDVTGLPWDERIHAANAGKNQDGKWRKKKGLNDGAYIGQVEAELRSRALNPGNTALHADAAKLAAMGVDPLTAQPLVPPPPASAPVAGTLIWSEQPPAPPPATPLEALVAAQPPAVVPPPPVAPPAPAAGPDTTTFRGLMEWLTPLMTTGKVPFPAVAAAVQAHGLNVLSDMAQPQNAHLVPGVYAMLAAGVK